MRKITFERSRGKGEWTSEYSIFEIDILHQRTLEELHPTLKGILHFFKPIDLSPRIGFIQITNARQFFPNTASLPTLTP